jgi:glycosyltransferase involved in cell wall biosynthesis
MNILFVHSNFPAQFRFLAEVMSKRGDRCVAIASHTGQPIQGVPLARWRARRGSTEGIFDPATRAEADLIRGYAAAECAMALKQQGFTPDLIIGHPGWGETLLLREIFKEARQILYGEFYYRSTGADSGFDPEFDAFDVARGFRVQAKNATLALAYVDAERIVCPTAFQASLLPSLFRSRASVVHEGVDTKHVDHNAAAQFALTGGRVLDRSTPVITFINRRFEPQRGFHIFMRALPKVLVTIPDVEVLLIGSDDPDVYGVRAPAGTTWKQRFLDEVKDRVDERRIHFTGHLPHDRMLAALSISTAHVYYTYPFVLSWSLLEAMACKCLVVASDTAPVRDAIENGANGLLLDFFDVDGLSDALIRACRNPEAFLPLRQAARDTVVARFDRDRVCRPAWLDLVKNVLGGEERGLTPHEN